MAAAFTAELRTEVFAAAQASKGWKRTNLGLRTEVRVGRYDYVVEIPTGYRAEITYRSAWGNTDFLGGEHATVAQHRALAKRAAEVLAARA